jgi:hypothetical protein
MTIAPKVDAGMPSSSKVNSAAGARSFDLAELGGVAGGAPALRHVSHAADSLGWTYSFAACGDVAPLPAACAGVAPGSAALQQTAGACYGLGGSSFSSSWKFGRSRTIERPRRLREHGEFARGEHL